MEASAAVAGAAAAVVGFEVDAATGSFGFGAVNAAENTFEGVPNLGVSAGGLTTPAVANFTKGDELFLKGKGSGVVTAAVLVGAIGVGDGLDSLEGEGDLAPKVERPNV